MKHPHASRITESENYLHNGTKIEEKYEEKRLNESGIAAMKHLKKTLHFIALLVRAM